MRVSELCETCVHRKVDSMVYPCNICNPEVNKYQEHRKKCGYAHKYQALRAPTCGCDFCNTKWRVSEFMKQLGLRFDEELTNANGMRAVVLDIDGEHVVLRNKSTDERIKIHKRLILKEKPEGVL